MQRCWLLVLFLLPVRFGFTQSIKTVVPPGALTLGKPFQVQFIISRPEEFYDFIHPSFEGFTLVAGPSFTKGFSFVAGKLEPIQNISFTLVPQSAGRKKIRSIKGIKGKAWIEGDDVHVDVIKAPASTYIPGKMAELPSLSAPSQKIEDDIFIKTDVSRTSCYTGEPVVATFTLFSRLESTSEAERSPAFYGFSVLDLVDINKPNSSLEIYKGRMFNTSILRKVLLYPVQPGNFTIDAMYVHNTIEVDDPLTEKKLVMEREITSRMYHIQVKPLPGVKPTDFSGAVGNFTITSSIQKEVFHLNQQGKLIISLKGNGNFIQIDQPVVEWPELIEPYDPIVKENIFKSERGLEGEKVFEFSFAANAVGEFHIPPVRFSYFDPVEKKYKEVQSSSSGFTVLHPVPVNRLAADVRNFPWKPVLFIFFLVTAVSLIIIRKMKNKDKVELPKKEIAPVATESSHRAIDPADMSAMEGCLFLLRNLKNFEKKYSQDLKNDQVQELQSLKEDCQMMVYAGTTDHSRFNRLFTRSEALFSSKNYSAYL